MKDNGIPKIKKREREVPTRNFLSFESMGVKVTNKPPLVARIMGAMGKKQMEDSNIQKRISDHFTQKSQPSNFMDNLQQQFSSNLETSMLEHMQNINNYLFIDKRKQCKYACIQMLT